VRCTDSYKNNVDLPACHKTYEQNTVGMLSKQLLDHTRFQSTPWMQMRYASVIASDNALAMPASDYREKSMQQIAVHRTAM